MLLRKVTILYWYLIWSSYMGTVGKLHNPFTASATLDNHCIHCIAYDRHCGLVVTVPGYRTELYCTSCEVRTEFIYICYSEESRPPLWSSGQSSWLQNGDALYFLRGTNWIYICYAEESRPPLWSSGQSSWLQNGDVLCFLWGTNWIYICYAEESRPPLWSSGQSSWLQNGDVLCFLWGTNWVYMCYVE
jgi:hypothetical protein